MGTDAAISAEDMARYRATLQAREAREARALVERRDRLRRLARQAADLLRREFGAGKVVLFGSLAHERWFSTRSDIDLAAWGLDPEGHLVALARLEDLAPDVSIDLVRVEHTSDALRDVIRREGLELWARSTNT